MQAVVLLKDEDAGRAALVVADAEAARPVRPHVRDAGRPLLDFVQCEPVLQPVVDHLLERWTLVADLREAADLAVAPPRPVVRHRGR